MGKGRFAAPTGIDIMGKGRFAAPTGIDIMGKGRFAAPTGIDIMGKGRFAAPTSQCLGRCMTENRSGLQLRAKPSGVGN